MGGGSNTATRFNTRSGETMQVRFLPRRCPNVDLYGGQLDLVLRDRTRLRNRKDKCRQVSNVPYILLIGSIGIRPGIGGGCIGGC